MTYEPITILKVEPPFNITQICNVCLSRVDVMAIVAGHNGHTTSIVLCAPCRSELRTLLERKP